MEFYDRLIQVLDAFVGMLDGGMRIRKIQTLLLVQKATHYGKGISPSQVRALTGAPLENVRRLFVQLRERSLLESHPDPLDHRVTLFTTTDAGDRTWRTEKIVRALHAIGPPGKGAPGKPHALEPDTYDAMIAVLQAFMDALDGTTRIRGFKTAILIQQATLAGTGITVSELSRRTNAAPETIRRHVAKHVRLGNLKIVEDPNDDRANRVFTAHPDREDRNWRRVWERLEAVDWSAFDIAW